MTQSVNDPSSQPTVSPTAADSDVTERLKGALAHLRAGRLPQAKDALEAMRKDHPGSAGAVHFLGLVAHQEGDHQRAIELLEQAVSMNHVVPFFHGNLGEVYRSMGRYDEAIASCRRALELIAVYPEALNTLGAALLETGELDEAEQVLRRAIEFQPDMAAAHANLGNVMRARGNLERAVKSYRQAIRRDPKHPGVHMALGNALRATGEPEEAIEAYRRALELNPNDAKTWSNLGTTLRRQGRNQEALECLQKAVALGPGLADVHTNLGTVLLVLGRMDEAVECYATALKLKRTPTWQAEGGDAGALDPEAARDANFRTTTAAKLRHDIEQFRYLLDRGVMPPEFAEELAKYERLLQELGTSRGSTGRVALTSPQRDAIAGSYNKLVHVAPAPALEDSPINPGLDVEAIEADYLRNAPGITYLDHLLTPEALGALRKFCLESTIWFDFEYRNGYLGAYLSDGFFCDLLFQIAGDLRLRFPRIFGQHELRQMWGYKYDSQLSGIEHHADAAAVNVNFWVTPDEANLDPEHGGLVVYTREAPLEWDFEKFNRDQQALIEFLEDSDSITVPYRQNRAVVFNSNLIHKTDTIRFKEGYENRRINITMLFGWRGEAVRG